MHFCPERLIQVRESLHINKAEAARRLNLSAMAYGRYERGEREPSYQYAFYIAYTFHCNLDFLYGQSDEMETDFITITRSDSEEVYSLVEEMQNNSDFEKRILAYAEKFTRNFLYFSHIYYFSLCTYSIIPSLSICICSSSIANL